MKKTEKILPFYRDEDGGLHVNACCSEANSDPIRAGRLARAAKNGDKLAAAELARMSDTAMVRKAEDSEYYILNLQPFVDDGGTYAFSGFYRKGLEFGQFDIERQFVSIRPDKTCQWRDYDHFAGVAGKFDIYLQLLREPVEVDRLDYDALTSIQGLYEKRLRG